MKREKAAQERGRHEGERAPICNARALPLYVFSSARVSDDSRRVSVVVVWCRALMIVRERENTRRRGCETESGREAERHGPVARESGRARRTADHL